MGNSLFFPHKFHLCHFSCSVKCTRDKEKRGLQFLHRAVPACAYSSALPPRPATRHPWETPSRPATRLSSAGRPAPAAPKSHLQLRRDGTPGRSPPRDAEAAERLPRRCRPWGSAGRETAGQQGGEEKALRGVRGKGVGVGLAGGR